MHFVSFVFVFDFLNFFFVVCGSGMSLLSIILLTLLFDKVGNVVEWQQPESWPAITVVLNTHKQPVMCTPTVSWAGEGVYVVVCKRWRKNRYLQHFVLDLLGVASSRMNLGAQQKLHRLLVWMLYPHLTRLCRHMPEQVERLPHLHQLLWDSLGHWQAGGAMFLQFFLSFFLSLPLSFFTHSFLSLFTFFSLSLFIISRKLRSFQRAGAL